MAQTENSLAWLFGIRPRKEGEHRLDDQTAENIAREVMVFVGALLGPRAPMAVANVVDCVATVMEKSIHEIAVSAWNKRAEVMKYAETTQYPAGQEHYVTLYDHPVKWSYKPYVDIKIAGVAKHSIEIAIEVTLNFAQAVLIIDGGKIIALKPGKVLAEASAKFSGATLCEPIKKELGMLPGRVSFGDGILIPRKASAAASFAATPPAPPA